MLLPKVSLALVVLFLYPVEGIERIFSPNGSRSGPLCTLGMKDGDYLVLGRAFISIPQTLALRPTDSNTVSCSATYPIDFEMSGVTTQLMNDDVRSQYKTFKRGNSIDYSVTVSLTNLLAPRHFTFYKVNDRRNTYSSFFLIRNGKLAFPDKGQTVPKVKSDREILTLPCIVSDPNPTKMSLKLKKLVNEKKHEDSNQTSISEGKLVRTTKQQINTIVEDEFPWDEQFLRYDKTQGFLLNTTYFGNPSGDFSCIYTHPNSNSPEERFPVEILPHRDIEYEPKHEKVTVFQNGELHLSCRSKMEVILQGNFNGTFINVESTQPSYKTDLVYHAEYYLETPIIGDTGHVSCYLKNNRSRIIVHSWTIESLDMWDNSKLNLSIKSKSVHCKSAEGTPQLSYILCSSESNCRHRIPCFLPGNSCPSSERVRHGSTCADKESCLEISTDEGFVLGVIGCNIGQLSAWTYFVKALDGKIYKDWNSAPATSMMEIVVPKEKLYADGIFQFACRFSTFISNGGVQWYYRKINETTLFTFPPGIDNRNQNSPKRLIKLKSSMSHIICSVLQWDGKASWNVSQRINVEKSEAPTEKILGHSKNPIFVKSQTGRSISCAAHGLPQPKISWFKQGMVKLPSSFQEIQTNNEDNVVELRFPIISEQHGGVYVCNASNLVGFVLQNFTVEVKDNKDPHFDNRTIEHVFFIGDTPELRCIVEGYPRPSINWTYPTTKISKQNPITVSDSGLKTISSIRFNSISVNDEGDYVCTATNEFGKASQNHVVKVQERSSPLMGLIIGATIAIVALFIPLVIVFWRLQVAKKEIRDLTTAEVEEFFHGNLNEKNRVQNSYVDDIQGFQTSLFSSLPYNNEFEITKDALNIDENNLLGEGAYGMVLRANIKGTPVAVKTVKPNSEVSYFKALLSELKIMIYIEQHPNVVTLIGAYTKNIKRRELYIAVELCEHGSLDKYLQRISNSRLFRDEIVNDDVAFPYLGDRNTSPDHDLMKRRLDDKDGKVYTSDLVCWSYQIANGMSYLASKKVIHSDLSTRNVLLHEDGTIRITDFGLSRQLYDYTQYVKKNQSPLPWRWMAIESLRNMSFSTQSDVWSFGVTMWELFSLADVPYPGRSWTVDFVEELTNGLRMTRPRYATSTIYSIMYDCWTAFPESRPSFNELMTAIFRVAYGERQNIFD